MKIKWNTTNKNNIHPLKNLKWGSCSINEKLKMTLEYEDEVKKVHIERKFKSTGSALNVMNTVLFRIDLHYRGYIHKKLNEAELLKIFPANPSNFNYTIYYKERQENE